MTDIPESTVPVRSGARRDPPAQAAKVISAGASASALLGLVALLGWSAEPTPTPAPTSTSVQPVGSPTSPTVALPTTPTTLVPLLTTLVPATLAPATLAPATGAPATLAPVPEPAPSQAVSEQSR